MSFRCLSIIIHFEPFLFFIKIQACITVAFVLQYFKFCSEHYVPYMKEKGILNEKNAPYDYQSPFGQK